MDSTRNERAGQTVVGVAKGFKKSESRTYLAFNLSLAVAIRVRNQKIIKRINKIDTPNAKKEQTKSPKCYGVINSKGKKLAFPLHGDKRVPEKILKDLVAAQYKNDLGHISPFAKHLSRPISDHLEMYIMFLEEKDRDERYLKDCKRKRT